LTILSLESIWELESILRNYKYGIDIGESLVE